MNNLIIEGGHPLIGEVNLSGSLNSALKLIPAALFSSEDVLLENVPKVASVESDLEVLRSLGAKAEWLTNNQILINGSTLRSYEIPYDIGSRYRTVGLLAAPLLYRFGQAVIPKSTGRPINRWIDTWKQLGIEYREDARFMYLKSGRPAAGDVHFKTSTHTGTDNAILTAIALPRETVISNASQASEVDDLIAFCNKMGAEVKRTDSRSIKIAGKNIFNGAKFKVQNDITEAIMFAAAAIITKGNIRILGVDKTTLTAFTNVLAKINCHFEFLNNEFRVWYGGDDMNPVNINTSPAPGFLTDWKPYLVLMLGKAVGDSLVHDTVFVDRFDFLKDLNRMGANIDLFKPSEAGLTPVISDDNYDYEKLGEPSTVTKVHGPVQLKAARLYIDNLKSGAVLILAALSAAGKSEIGGYKIIETGFDNILGKLSGLGAKIYVD